VVDLSFAGQAPVDFGGLPDVYGIFNFDQDAQVLTLANWYPLLAVWQPGGWQVEPVIGVGDAVVSETALYQVDVTAPEWWGVVTSGTGTQKTPQGKNTRWEFVSGPMREFIVLTSPNFIETQAEVHGIQVRHWGLEEGEARWAEALQATVDSLTIYEDRFGPYPYSELDVVAAPMKNAAGVEYPGVFLILDSLYLPNQERPFFLGLVVAHEAAHQWWYGVVGSDVLQDPWQDEGLTTFSSLVYQEVYQPDYYLGTRQFYEQIVDEFSSRAGDNGIGQPVTAFLNQENAYSVVVYDRGALFFEELRQQLGDQKFYAALQAYYNVNRFKLATPESLLMAFETACACNLDATYTEWGVD
jgi:aminopeptidase N